MDIELQKTNQENQPDTKFSERESTSQIASLDTCIDNLHNYGGMRLVKSLIHDTENLDPRRKALHDIYLTDPLYKESRKELEKTLSIWIDFLEKDFIDPDTTSEYCLEQCHKVEKNLSDNLFTVREEIKELEKTYRVLDTFFAYTGQEKTDILQKWTQRRRSRRTSQNIPASCGKDLFHHRLSNSYNSYSEV